MNFLTLLKSFFWSQPMQVMAWAQISIACPMIRAVCTNDAASEADAVAAKLASQPFKVVFLTSVLNGFLANITQDQIQSSVPPVEKYLDWATAFWRALRGRNITPDFVVLDQEDWVKNYNYSIPADVIQAARWNRNIALRRGVYWPLADAYRKFIPLSNFGDSVSNGPPLMDQQGGLYPPSLDYSVAGVSSPDLYLRQEGWYFKGKSLTKDILWNNFIRNINNARACSDPFVPWISYPSWGGDNPPRKATTALQWTWAEQLKHLRATGVKQLLLWNPNMADTDIISAGMTSANARKVGSGTLGQLAMDSDTVTTGDVTTNYSDFLERLQADGLKPTPSF